MWADVDQIPAVHNAYTVTGNDGPKNASSPKLLYSCNKMEATHKITGTYPSFRVLRTPLEKLTFSTKPYEATSSMTIYEII